MTATYAIETINRADGSVDGHAAGCKDIARIAKKERADRSGAWEATSKLAVWVDYNSDFIYECEAPEGECDHDNGKCSNAYTINWLPCADHVPATAEVEEAPVETKTDVTVKRGPKWSYIFVNGEQVMEVRSTLVDAVLATVDFS